MERNHFFCRILQSWYRIEALFHSSKLRSPKPPSFLGLQQSSQDTLTCFVTLEEPPHRNLAQTDWIFLKTPFCRNKLDAQYPWTPKRTIFNNCSLPAWLRNKLVQQSICLHSRKIRGKQSWLESFVEIRGRPRYVMGNLPSWKPVEVMVCCIISWETLAKKHWLLAQLGFKPETDEKQLTPAMILATDSISPLQNRNTSSAKISGFEVETRKEYSYKRF